MVHTTIWGDGARHQLELINKNQASPNFWPADISQTYIFLMFMYEVIYLLFVNRNQVYQLFFEKSRRADMRDRHFMHIYIQGVQEKLCFFTVRCNPSLAFISLKETLKVLNAMRVYSRPYLLAFFVQPTEAECWRGRGSKLLKILGKKIQYSMSTLYSLIC